MFFEGVHRTSYAYSEPVFLDPHTLRLRPRSDPRQTVRRFSIDMTPPPDGMTEGIDVYGNDVVWVWFSGTHPALEITTRFAVETLRENPYDFIVPTLEASTIAPSYPDVDREVLQVYLQPATSESVRGLARQVADATGGELVPFLSELAGRIHRTCATVVRPEGDPLPADETLAAVTWGWPRASSAGISTKTRSAESCTPGERPTSPAPAGVGTTPRSDWPCRIAT
jgi:transglutaminase-like putative cysteine protease